MIGSLNRRKTISRSDSAGFALVASLILLSLLIVLIVALMSLLRVETQSTQSTMQSAKARQNAIAALQIAMGELQTQLGPDQRITARAATMVQHPDLPTGTTAAGARAWWVGVSSSSSDPADMLNYDPGDPLAGVPVLAPTWLLSGLDDTLTPEQQITTADPFIGEEVVLYSPNSLDSLPIGDPAHITGGEPITAGTVSIRDENGDETGRYAYFVDDEGMKAQLIAKNSDVRNDDSDPSRPGGSVIPGTYDLSILTGMDSFPDGTNIDDFINNLSKLTSLAGITLTGASPDIAVDKKFHYTLRSLGVLSDVKEGGLKRDLTIAFENFTTSEVTKNAGTPEEGTYPNFPDFPVFNAAFAKTDPDNWGDYLVVSEDKRSEFGPNGYIHWAMLRDYYNTKRYIRRDSSGRDYLELITIHRDNFNSGNSGPKPNIAPHAYGPDTFTFRLAEKLPYGDFDTMPTPNTSNPLNKEFLEYYKHSPITPIIVRLQYNSWLEEFSTPASSPGDPDIITLQTNTQVWASHYNPYNLTLQISGDWASQQAGPRLAEMPQAQFRIPDTMQLSPIPSDDDHFSSVRNPGFYTISSLMGRRAVHLTQIARLPPGRALLCAYDQDTVAGSGNEADRGHYGTNVANLVFQSIFRNFNTSHPPPTPSMPNADWFVDIYSVSDFFTHGVDNFTNHPMDDNHFEWAQVIWSPIAFEPVTATRTGPYSNGYIHAGKIIEIDEATYTQSATSSFAMFLQPTTSSDPDALRPLVDANIRAMFFNPRWDSPLDLDMVAPYRWEVSTENYVFPQMRKPSDHGDGTSYSYTYWGSDHDTTGWDQVILFDIPREDLVSLGQLQHANLGRFNYEPTYVVGNSYANPRIPLNKWTEEITDTFATTAKGFRADQRIQNPFDIYDASYLVNEVLWDSYVFTTIPQVNDNYDDPDDPDPSPDPVTDAGVYTDLLSGATSLPNPRYLPYEPDGADFDADNLQGTGTGSPTASFYHNAGFLLVDGAFNVNSTSVDAWEAFLSGTYGMPFQKLDDNGQVGDFEPGGEYVRFPRVQSVFGDPMETGDEDENYWVGFRALLQSEVRALAEAIVNQIRQRGPFLTLGEFVNRKLQTGALGEKGALQAALDETVNDSPPPAYSSTASTGGNQAAGFPGQLLQGDILQALAPMMTVRSDTFTIRAYGESINPASGAVAGRAWCEAVVQRFPDPVDGNGNLNELAQPGSRFGREFRIISFRWLNQNEI